MPNKTQFRYVTAYSTYKDTIRVTYTKRYIHPEDLSLNRDYKAEADLAIIVEATKGISEDERKVHHETQTNQTVLKVLHNSTKGVFYTQRVEKGYSGKTQRVYLTEEQLKDMHEFIWTTPADKLT